LSWSYRSINHCCI